MQAAAVEHNLPVFVEDVGGSERAMRDLVFMQFVDGLAQLDGYPQTAGFRKVVYFAIEAGAVVLLN